MDEVHHVDCRGPTQVQCTRGHEQTDGASPEDRHALPWRDASEFGGMVARGEGISQQHEIVFSLVSRFSRQAQAISISKGDTDSFRLGPPVRSHPGIAIRSSSRSRIGD
jgi:hypothetical protein